MRCVRRACLGARRIVDDPVRQIGRLDPGEPEPAKECLAAVIKVFERCRRRLIVCDRGTERASNAMLTR
jgi:hypothetical protein